MSARLTRSKSFDEIISAGDDLPAAGVSCTSATSTEAAGRPPAEGDESRRVDRWFLEANHGIHSGAFSLRGREPRGSAIIVFYCRHGLRRIREIVDGLGPLLAGPRQLMSRAF